MDKIIDGLSIHKEETKDIIMMLCYKDHFIVVKIIRSSEDDLIPVKIACSLDQNLTTLETDLKEINFTVFLHAVLGSMEYQYEKADEVCMQSKSSNNDCGIFCLQRMYCYAKYQMLLTKEQQNSTLYAPHLFRLYILWKILEHFEFKLSKYIFDKDLKTALTTVTIMLNTLMMMKY
jgi:hypothetical protein